MTTPEFAVALSDKNKDQTLSSYIEYVRGLSTDTGKEESVIYTVSIGGDDYIRQPKVVDKNATYICFSDTLVKNVGLWKVVNVSRKYRDDRRTSRAFKMMPHILFPDAAVTVYVDASIVLSGSVSEFVARYCGSNGISMFVHPGRSCVYVEAQACIDQKKDDVDVLSAQVASYRQEGFPENYGLVAGGVIIRRRDGDGVSRLLEAWLAELDKFSLREQVSFPYVAWKQEFKFNAIPLDIYDNAYFRVFPHKSGRNAVLLYRLKVLREHVGRAARRFLRLAGFMHRPGDGL